MFTSSPEKKEEGQSSDRRNTVPDNGWIEEFGRRLNLMNPSQVDC